MEGVIDLITGAFVALVPLLFLLLRRRRAAGRRPASRRPEPEAAESLADPEAMPAGGGFVAGSGPGSGSMPGPRKAASGGSVIGTGTGAPAVSASGVRAATSASKPAPPQRGRPAESTVWHRINQLSPARRAIVTSELISKPLALRKEDPWL